MKRCKYIRKERKEAKDDRKKTINKGLKKERKNKYQVICLLYARGRGLGHKPMTQTVPWHPAVLRVLPGTPRHPHLVRPHAPSAPWIILTLPYDFFISVIIKICSTKEIIYKNI